MTTCMPASAVWSGSSSNWSRFWRRAGIGAGIAAMLAEAGAAVAVADIDGESAASTAKGIENRGGRAITVTADVSDARDIDAMVRQTVTDLGGVDILVNNAGIATTELVEDLDEEKWRGVLDVNLTGPFLCCKAVLPHSGASWRRSPASDRPELCA